MRLWDFLAAELASTPGRWPATMRIVFACVVATTLIMTLQVPYGYYVIVTIFIVSQSDSGASLRKAGLRVLGTLIGGGVGLFFLIATLDRPWVRIPLLGPVAAFFIFLSATTTAPYLGTLGGITVALVLTAPSGTDVAGATERALWRIALIALGTLIGTLSQVVLWPSDPEALLVATLVERLRAVELFVSGRLANAPPADVARLESLALTGLTRQLDLLSDAEARHPSLQQRHTEQIALIAGVELLLNAAIAFAHAEAARGGAALPDQARRRLAAIGEACERAATALEARRPFAEAPGNAVVPDEAVAAAGGAALLPALVDMERALTGIAPATAFLAEGEPGRRSVASPLDVLGLGEFFTPAFSLDNGAAVAFALKTGLATTIAYVVYEGLAWPGISTSVLTTLVVAQSSFGATMQKLLLRIVGASVGGLLGLLLIVTTSPNIDTLPPFLVAVGICCTLAAWVAVGSARISYAGLQIGLALGLCVIGDLGPTTDLVPARDRVVGVLLGGLVSGLVYYLFSPVFAASEMRAALARTLRSLAILSRIGLSERPSIAVARGHRWQVYQDLAMTLRLHDESKFEPGAGTAEARAARESVARLAEHAQAVFLALLSVVRHRIDVSLGALPDTVRQPLRTLGDAIGDVLEAVADRVEGKGDVAVPPLAALLSRAEAAAVDAEGIADPRLAAHLQGRLAAYHQLVARLELLERDVERGGPIPDALPAAASV
jgi:multidrug resistance protein MdtO